ncbi:MAG: ABC transporter substrate-binding protein, partial [Acidimicrobiales bacterium]
LLVPPLNDPDVRKALAMSINKADLLATFGAGLSTPVTSPFVPGELWYTSTNYPKEDPKAAAQLIARYKARTGNTPEIKLTTIQGPQYLQVVDLVQQNWNSIGVHTSVAQVEFAQFLTEAVVGTYQACTFEQFGATDPDQNYIWWSTDTFAPVNQVSLNMARNRDTRIQNALDKGRQSTNLGDRADAYKSVSKLLAEDLPYLWLGKTYWSAVAANDVVGIMGQSLPDGATSIGFDNGAFLVHELARTK